MEKLQAYRDFLVRKTVLASNNGFAVNEEDLNPTLMPHQRSIIRWACAGGNRAIFAKFGLMKSRMQIEILRQCGLHRPSAEYSLITAPLGMRVDFAKDAAAMGVPLRFIRTDSEIDSPGIYLTNFESVREGKITPGRFGACSLDEASVLRGFGGTKTFREFMRVFEEVPHRFVATAIPDPNDHIELLAYAAFLGIMDVGQAKTRFFKRDSTNADNLTIHPHKQREFWLWVASWSVFLQRPSQLGFSDEGFDMPPMDIRYHEVAVDHRGSPAESNGQETMFRGSVKGMIEASREKRDTIPARVAKLAEIVAESPEDHFLLWHDMEAERKAIEKVMETFHDELAHPCSYAPIPTFRSVFGSQPIPMREEIIRAFAEGEITHLAAKPMMYGSGCNFQYFCHRAIFAGVGFKFNDFIQAIYRIYRFGQKYPVRIDIIHAESEREVLRELLDKWRQHEETVAKMSEIIEQYGLDHADMMKELARSIGCERTEVRGRNYTAIKNDCVEETMRMPAESVDLVVTSIPFSTQYEYTPSYNDFGHTDSNDHFFEQLNYLTPELLRVLRPGRIAAIHVKDRIVPGGMTGLGFQTVYPFHAATISHFCKHGFAFMGMKTIVTDVVRENNQTYRLSYSEMCKDTTTKGVGTPEYLLLFRKPQSDSTKGYADNRVVKHKKAYTLARWQLQASGFDRSSGDRLMNPDELAQLEHAAIYKIWKQFNLENVYDFEYHVAIGEQLERLRMLPTDFCLIPPHSWSPDVWSDVVRMGTMNKLLAQAGKQMHLCPLQFDIADRTIEQFTNEGEIVYDPFGGVMTVPYRALKLGRKGIGCELNAQYFLDGCAYLEATERELEMPSLFDALEPVGVEAEEGVAA